MNLLRLASTMLAMATPHPQHAQVSWYGPGFYGHRTSCGQVLTTDSYWAAALVPQAAGCGKKYTLFYRGRTYRIRIEDRGAWRSDGRMFDLAPGLRRAMHVNGVAEVTYTTGWH